MVPSPEQIRMAAYFRWRRRGEGHGLDQQDWDAAEQEARFTVNYQVVASYRLDGPARTVVGGEGRTRVCRFCERSAPRAKFAAVESVPTLPAELGNTSLVSADLCEECREEFAESLDGEFRRSVLPLLTRGEGGGPLPIAAYKSLVRLGLGILPGRDLDDFRDAMEWVGNPDHDFDGGVFAEFGVQWHRALHPASGPWAALARRVEADVLMPSVLFFLGTRTNSLQVPLPLGSRDEDLEGHAATFPKVASPVEPRDGVSTFLPVASRKARRALPLS